MSILSSSLLIQDPSTYLNEIQKYIDSNLKLLHINSNNVNQILNTFEKNIKFSLNNISNLDNIKFELQSIHNDEFEETILKIEKDKNKRLDLINEYKNQISNLETESYIKKKELLNELKNINELFITHFTNASNNMDNTKIQLNTINDKFKNELSQQIESKNSFGSYMVLINQQSIKNDEEFGHSESEAGGEAESEAESNFGGDLESKAGGDLESEAGGEAESEAESNFGGDLESEAESDQIEKMLINDSNSDSSDSES